METEHDLARKVQHYLVAKLAYPQASISLDVRSSYGRVDMVVYDQEAPRIAVEVKSGEGFPEDQDADALRFHPYVRQAQSHAKALGAPYYLLTNGKAFLWFKTDETGRPSLIREPIYATVDGGAGPLRLSKNTIVRILQELVDQQWKSGLHSTDEIAVAIYAKLLDEHGDSRLKQELLLCEGNGARSHHFLSEILSITRGINRTEYYSRAFDILGRISFSSAEPYDVLSAVDELLIHPEMRVGTLVRLPRWLNDFLAQLGRVQREDVVLDMYSDYGDLQAALLMSESKPKVWTVSHSSKGMLWARIQRLILGDRDDGVVVGNSPPYDVYHNEDFPDPTCIFVVPPFGGRHELPDEGRLVQGKSNASSEELYLELALRWVRPGGRVVAVVPDSLLFHKSKGYLRKFLLLESRLTAIIGLGRFLPYAGILGSILVLDRAGKPEPYGVFMARVERQDVQDTFNCRRIPQISSVLAEFEKWLDGGPISENAPAWSVRSNELSPENLTVDRYMPSRMSGYEDLVSPYPMVPLVDIAELIRGSGLTLDKHGDLPVIGPASIRPMMISISDLDRTSQPKLRSKPRIVQAGDVVVNSISTHRGATAVVDEELDGVYTSRHVIIARPDRRVVLPEYLAAALNSDYVKRQLQTVPTGAVIPAFSLDSLRKLSIPLPDLDTQEQIVERIRARRDRWIQAQEEAGRAENEFREFLRNFRA